LKGTHSGRKRSWRGQRNKKIKNELKMWVFKNLKIKSIVETEMKREYI
jgi:hypothetical protein